MAHRQNTFERAVQCDSCDEIHSQITFMTKHDFLVLTLFLVDPLAEVRFTYTLIVKCTPQKVELATCKGFANQTNIWKWSIKNVFPVIGIVWQILWFEMLELSMQKVTPRIEQCSWRANKHDSIFTRDCFPLQVSSAPDLFCSESLFFDSRVMALVCVSLNVSYLRQTANVCQRQKTFNHLELKKRK